MFPLIAGIITAGAGIIGSISNASAANAQANAVKANAQAQAEIAKLQYQQSLVAAQSSNSKTMWLVIGGIGAAAIVAFIVLRKRR